MCFPSEGFVKVEGSAVYRCSKPVDSTGAWKQLKYPLELNFFLSPSQFVVCLSMHFQDGGWEGWTSNARETLCAPGFPCHRRSLDEATDIISETQANKQSPGSFWTCAYLREICTFYFPNIQFGYVDNLPCNCSDLRTWQSSSTVLQWHHLEISSTHYVVKKWWWIACLTQASLNGIKQSWELLACFQTLVIKL